MNGQLPVPIVSVSWLAAHLDQPDLVLLDASLPPVATSRAQQSLPATLRLPRARVFDFDSRICDQQTSLPHMMPSSGLFEEGVRALGICKSSQLVVYDRVGVYSSPRAWWMFKAMGHDCVSVLDGGLPAWLAAGLRCESAAASPPARGDFAAKPRPELFCSADHVSHALTGQRFTVLDARSEARFTGREEEPRAGLRAGHMPNAVNLPFSAVQQQVHMRDAAELATLFASKVRPGSSSLIFSCGSGVTACILALAGTLAGYSDMTVYDGSWSEWGLPSSRPVCLP
ncbi:MAG TPA: sulfurtransferase [Polyangiaceae bacterium]|nr:sulfurtransferase [Polyangiaceae bacterium]